MIQGVANATSSGEELLILSVRVLISVLDGFHDFYGLPW